MKHYCPKATKQLIFDFEDTKPFCPLCGVNLLVTNDGASPSQTNSAETPELIPPVSPLRSEYEETMNRYLKEISRLNDEVKSLKLVILDLKEDW